MALGCCRPAGRRDRPIEKPLSLEFKELKIFWIIVGEQRIESASRCGFGLTGRRDF